MPGFKFRKITSCISFGVLDYLANPSCPATVHCRPDFKITFPDGTSILHDYYDFVGYSDPPAISDADKTIWLGRDGNLKVAVYRMKYDPDGVRIKFSTYAPCGKHLPEHDITLREAGCIQGEYGCRVTQYTKID